MSTISIILYKPQTPLDPYSASQTGTEQELSVGAQGNCLTLDGIKYTCTVENLKFEKKVYSPCLLTFQLNISEITDAKNQSVTLAFSVCPKIANALKNYGVKLQYKNVSNSKNAYACLNYYVYNVKPQFSTSGGNSSIKLFVTAYSVDHRLSLQKTNRAVTAKKFVTDIAMGDLTTGMLKGVGVPVNHKSTPKYLQFIKAYTKTEVKKLLSGEELAEYTDGNEIIQPYMVQYNESYYNFLARTANRCGEFMYFEDGQLSIGLDKPYYETPDLIDYDTEAVPSGKSKCRKDTVTGVTLNTLAEHSTPALEPYYPRTMDHKSPSVTFAGSNFVEDAKVGNDEFLITMKKGEWVKWDDDLFMPEGLGGLLTGIIAQALNNQTLLSGIMEIGLKSAIAIGSTKKSASDINDTMDSGFWEKYNNDEKVVTKDSESYMFTSNTDQWDQNLKDNVIKEDFQNELRAEFYHALLTLEREVMQEAITVETGVDYDEEVKLGKVVQVNGVKYVVVAVNGSYENSGARGIESYSFTGIPVKEISLSNPISITYKTSKEVPGALGTFTPGEDKPDSISDISAIIPPLYEHGHICTSAMQRAIVTTNADPQNKGRVQIKYPWQASGDSPSPFIRMAKDFAGDDFGINFKPEKNAEVLIDYDCGNVERPYVVGMLHSFVDPPQFQPRSIKSVNGHKIVFNDPIDGTKMFWNAAGGAFSTFTQVFPLGEWGPTKAHHSELKELAGGIELSDAYGFYKIAMSTDKRQIDIACPLGKIDINAFTGITINAPNGDVKISGKNVEIEATNNLNICSGSQIKRKYISYDSASDVGTDVASTALAAVIGTITNLIMPDLSLMRSIIEAFIKPCNGTLRLKSYRYMMLESGFTAVAQIPASAYKEGKVPTLASMTDKLIKIKPNDKAKSWKDLLAILENQAYRDSGVKLIKAYNATVAARNKLSTTIDLNNFGLKGASQDEKNTHKDAILAEFNGAAGNIDSHLLENGNISTIIISVEYKKAVNAKQTFNNLLGDVAVNVTLNNNIKLWDKIKGEIQGFNADGFPVYICNDSDADIKNLVDNIKFDKSVVLQACKNFIAALNDEYNADPQIVEPNNAQDAISYIVGLKFPQPSGLSKTFTAAKGAFSKNPTVNWVKELKNGSPFSRAWGKGSEFKGQILFSDSNTFGGATIPLKHLFAGDKTFDDTAGEMINTLPRIKQKMLALITNAPN